MPGYKEGTLLGIQIISYWTSKFAFWQEAEIQSNQVGELTSCLHHIP